jgi:hypothetical protein
MSQLLTGAKTLWQNPAKILPGPSTAPGGIVMPSDPVTLAVIGCGQRGKVIVCFVPHNGQNTKYYDTGICQIRSQSPRILYGSSYRGSPAEDAETLCRNPQCRPDARLQHLARITCRFSRDYQYYRQASGRRGGYRSPGSYAP